ncbi:MAG: LPP20 family lipoprotein [Spirochaetes bacterium]|nr:LPP20 family lipoprotein [Spirochaetota bacterium]
MKKILNIFLLVVMVVFMSIAIIGCEGGADVEEKKASSDSGSDYPDWFLNQPSAEDAIYAVGVAKKQNPQLAKDTAAARARNEIARVIKVKVSTMTKDFLEEAGVDDVTQSTEFTQVVSKQISDNTISGSKIDTIHVDKTTDPDTFYVLIKLSLSDMGGAIDEIVKANSAAYAKLQASRSFDDLAKELKELDSGAYETPVTPSVE